MAGLPFKDSRPAADALSVIRPWMLLVASLPSVYACAVAAIYFLR